MDIDKNFTKTFIAGDWDELLYYRCPCGWNNTIFITELDARLTSTGCCKACGTKRWKVVDKNGDVIA